MMGSSQTEALSGIKVIEPPVSCFPAKLTKKQDQDDEGPQLQRTCLSESLQLHPHLLQEVLELLLHLHGGSSMQAALLQEQRQRMREGGWRKELQQTL